MIDSDHSRDSRRCDDPGFACKRGSAKLAKNRDHHTNPSVRLAIVFKTRLAEVFKQHDVIRIAYDGGHAATMADLHERGGGQSFAKRIAPIPVDGPAMALCPVL